MKGEPWNFARPVKIGACVSALILLAGIPIEMVSPYSGRNTVALLGIWAGLSLFGTGFAILLENEDKL